MRIIDGKTDEAALSRMGHDAVRLLCSGDIGVLAERFGYALAFGRDPEIAIREDLANCLRELRSPGLAPDVECGCEVTCFKPNDIGLLAVVSCVAPTLNGREILLELVATSKGAETYATLEDISVIQIS